MDINVLIFIQLCIYLAIIIALLSSFTKHDNFIYIYTITTPFPSWSLECFLQESILLFVWEYKAFVHKESDHDKKYKVLIYK